ncbi:MAG: PEP/pyruvate-binding domain-containing protein [Desulfobaccales bacterium]
MSNFFHRLKGLFSKAPPASLEELRENFRKKYHAFRMLLAANNAALHLMTELELALQGTQSFGMTFIRSHSTAISVNVFSIIKYLNELTNNKYAGLEPVFAAIQSRLEAILSKRPAMPLEELVLPLASVNKEMADSVGAKMANVGELQNNVPGIAVPEGFVATVAAYELFLSHNELTDEINRRIQSMEIEDMATIYRLSSEIQMEIINSEMPPALGEAITGAYQALAAALGPDLRVSLRSSGIGEDSENISFAGQYRSELNVSPASLFEVYKEILASKYAPTAITYRLNKGIRDEDVAMCVGFMRMVDAKAGGVTYSRNPTDIRSDEIFINAVHGLAKLVVDGSGSPDLWIISRTAPLAIVAKEISNKQQKYVCLPEEGVCREIIDEEGKQPALTDEQALELASLALRLEEHFKSPQDIEWCIDTEGRLFILQSRPLKQLDLESRPEAEAPVSADHPLILRGGQMASPGVGAGVAYLVATNADLLSFPEGAVLVTAVPHPHWAPLLSRAAAVVTDRGGITGHLANVAREFRVPALFNTGDATQKISPQAVITVDADGMTIYQGRVESLLVSSAQRTSLMKGTPVYETLQEVLAEISPLNLTDPDGPEFRTANCRTLHDITRFAHEVAVRELFDYEANKELSKHFIKRLVTDVPMQWWVLDLENGFKEDVPGKEIRLGNIASIPMLALWQGITAVRWEGPPPVDAKGFMSVLAQSASQPQLEAAGPGFFANLNYFMISKQFCHLSSRFGFHFSTVEALVGEDQHENFLRFAFKGGGADFNRRLGRARLVQEILAQYHFKVDIKGDSLFARLEDEPMDYMLGRLRLLGYMSVHTRQLDMVMMNPAQVGHYHHKIIEDIEKYVLPSPQEKPQSLPDAQV